MYKERDEHITSCQKMKIEKMVVGKTGGSSEEREGK